jgi:hypothetical protein
MDMDELYNQIAVIIAVAGFGFGLTCMLMSHFELRKLRQIDAEKEARAKAEHLRFVALARGLPEHCDIWTSRTDAKKEKHAA